ncbi:uncharacterized protein LOC109598279 [Aethina tumida]|uniref:uncharacterized protein LOC109598279 n=1 Tax=Aethina tumida TaxID=116153 RepID=UPI002147B6B0|nr:uncharacterized protein LOC109598279 [Aethina tumida]
MALNIKFSIVIVAFVAVFPTGNATVSDVVTEIIKSHHRVNDAIVQTIQERLPPIPLGPNRLGKIFVSIRPENTSFGLTPESFRKLFTSNFVLEQPPRLPTLLPTFLRGAERSTPATNLNDLLPTRVPKIEQEIPPLTKEAKPENSPNTLLLSSTQKPVIGRTVPSVSVDIPDLDKK